MTGGGVTQTGGSPVLGDNPVQRPGATQTALQQQEAANPYPEVGPNDTVGQTLLKAGQQVGRGAANFGRVFTDELTHGSYDKRLAPSGPDAARASTQQAQDELGPGGNLAARGMGNLFNPIRKISEGGGLIRSGVEGGITGGWDAYEHGGTPLDVAWGTGTGALVNSGLSAAGKGIYQGMRRYAPQVGQSILSLADKIGLQPGGGTTSSITQDAKDAAQREFNALDQNKYNAAHVGNVADQVNTSVLSDPVSRTASPGTNKILTGFQKDIWQKAALGQQASAGDIHTQIKALNDVIAKGGFDAVSAKAARDQLVASLGGLPTTSGAPASAVIDQFNKANAAHGVYKNAQMLEGMDNNLGTYGDMPGPTAKKALDPQTGNPGFYKGPGQTEAMTNIAQSGDTAPSMLRPYATGVGTVGGGYFGHPIIGAGVGAVADAGRAVSAPSSARSAVYDAYPALTGASPVNPETAVTEALKRPGMGILSSGQGKPNPIDAVPGALSPFIFPYMMGQ